MKYKLLMFANVLIWGALGVRRFMLGDTFQGIVGVGLALFFFFFALKSKVETPEEQQAKLNAAMAAAKNSDAEKPNEDELSK